MFRYKLLAVTFSLVVAFTEEFSLLKAETPAPTTEPLVLDWPTLENIEHKEIEPLPLTFNVSASVYFPEPHQTQGDPFITADGSRISKKNPRKHRWIAVSRDLHSRWGGEIQFGDSVLVTGISDELDGIYVVRDTMNKRIRNRIDILLGRKDGIMGFWKDVQIAKLD